MSSKTEILATLTEGSYSQSQVRMLINSVHCDEIRQPPNVFRKGDAIRLRVNQTSNKTRPGIIIKVFSDYVVSIPLTSGEEVHSLCESAGSRFFKEGFFCNTFVVSPIDYANDNFLGVYDNMKSLNNAIVELRKFIVKNV
jgi:hypothetical protein